MIMSRFMVLSMIPKRGQSPFLKRLALATSNPHNIRALTRYVKYWQGSGTVGLAIQDFDLFRSRCQPVIAPGIEEYLPLPILIQAPG